MHDSKICRWFEHPDTMHIRKSDIVQTIQYISVSKFYLLTLVKICFLLEHFYFKGESLNAHMGLSDSFVFTQMRHDVR